LLAFADWVAKWWLKQPLVKAMPVIKISKRTIDEIGDVAKPTYFYDDEVKGFFVRVMPSGVKAFGFEFRAGSGRGTDKKRITIAKVGRITPDQARKMAREHSSTVVLGGNPHTEKRDSAAAMTVSELIDLYEAEGCVIQRGKRRGNPMKPLTKQYTIARLRHHVVPLLGGRKVRELEVADLERFHRRVGLGDTKSDTGKGRQRVIVRGGEGAARKVFRDLSAVLSFAENRGIVGRNISSSANVRKTDEDETRFLSVPEVVRLLDSLPVLKERGANEKALNIIALLVFTGCRRSEIEKLEWSEVDLDLRVLKLVDTKTGASVRPIADAAIAVLESLNAFAESRFVFPAERGENHYQGLKRVWAQAMEEAQLDNVYPQILRHTLGSQAALGAALPLVSKMLGHANIKTTMKYVHAAIDPAQKAATAAVGGFLSGAAVKS
jgi:integrase